jgi:pimeloyl-ACP methyl ester carboxylesterase
MREMSGADFACRTAASRFVSVNSLRLHFLESGGASRPAVCFLHGGSAHAHWFDRVIPAFSDRFHVIALDQRGHGESEWPDPPAYATGDFAADLLALMDALGWERATLVGHSMGGLNSMAFAAWHPERVRGLVVVDSRPMIPPERLGMMHARGRRPIRHYPSRGVAADSFRLLPRETFADPALLRHLGEVGVVEREGGWVYRFDPQCNGARQPIDAWTLVHRITAPTLIVRAERSPGLPPEQAERLRSAIPDARLVEIPDAYHHVTLDRPREFADALDRFLVTL